jgi:hypothetical protein
LLVRAAPARRKGMQRWRTRERSGWPKFTAAGTRRLGTV